MSIEEQTLHERQPKADPGDARRGAASPRPRRNACSRRWTAVPRPRRRKPSLAAPPRYLRVQIDADDAKDGEVRRKVNIRVPLQLLRAGVKLASVLPPDARERMNEALHEKGVGLDINQIRPGEPRRADRANPEGRLHRRLRPQRPHRDDQGVGGVVAGRRGPAPPGIGERRPPRYRANRVPEWWNW